MNDQLDLFRDSGPVRQVNEVVAALVARDAERATRCVATLRSHAPDEASLPALESLVRALAGWRAPDAAAPAIARAVSWLDEEVAPAARRGLGDSAGAFMRVFFQELAAVSRGLAYAEAQPSAHRAWLCLRCEAWADAEEAARAIERASTTPDALLWLAVARHRQQGLAAARAALFALAWHAPHRLEPALAEIHDELLTRDWRRFVAAAEWASVPEAELPAWFPAWYLLEHPAVRGELDYFSAPVTPPAEAARLLNRLIDLESRGDQHKLVAQREKLRALNVDLFSLYMARRSVQHL
jgi:hypothetical protein